MNDNLPTYRIKAWEVALFIIGAAVLVGFIMLGLFFGGAKL